MSKFDTVRLIPCGFSLAYNKDEILNQALQAIEDEQCTKLAEVLLYIPISEATFHEWGSEFSELIKAKIEEQKVKIKAKMKRKWFTSDVPALAIAAMKLIATEEEADALNTSKVKNEHKIELPKVTFEVINASKD